MVRVLALTLALSFITLALGAMGGAEASGNWSCYGGNAAHDHQSAFSSQNNRGGLAWTLEIDGQLGGQPIISDDGTLYVGDWNGNVTAIGPNGTIIRTVHLPGCCSDTMAFGKNGTIVLTTTDITPYGNAYWDADSTLFQLDPELNVIWTMNISGQASSPVVGEDGTIYLTTSGSGMIGAFGIYAITDGGEIEWFLPNSYETLEKTPSVGPDGTIYVGGSELPIKALSPEGTTLWEYRETDPGENNFPEQAIVCVGPDGTAYVGTAGHHMYAFDSEGGVKWSFEAPREIMTCASVASDGTVIFSTSDAYINDQEGPYRIGLYSLDQNGNMKWAYKMDAYPLSPAVISADGTIYFTDIEGHLFALDDQGTLLWRTMDSGPAYNGQDVPSPVIGADGTVYVVNGHLLRAYNIGTPPATGAISVRTFIGQNYVNWEPPSIDGGSAIIEYRVYRGGASDNSSDYELDHLVSVVPASEKLVYIDKGVEDGWTYWYKIAAVTEYGEGEAARAEVDKELSPMYVGAMVLALFLILGAFLLFGGSRQKGGLI